MLIHLVSPTKTGETYLFNKGLMPPLGLMYLAANTPGGGRVRLIDENVERLDFSERPDLVGITTMTATAPRAYEIADRYRSMGTRVVLGGVHASMVPDEASKHCDSVVIGEAEELWPEVLSDADAGELKPIYRREGFAEFRRPGLPDRGVIDPKRYWGANVIQTSRGCPHGCNFCSVTAFNGRGVRLRDTDNVLEEVETLRRHNLVRQKAVEFVDDNIGASPTRAKELFKALIPMKVVWGSQASISFAYDEELVALAAESGCHFLFIGLETLSRESLAEMGKKQNKVEKYAEALALLRRYKINVMGAFMFGFDADRPAVFSETLDFAIENKIQVAQFATLTPYPGTRIYAQLLEEGRVEPDFWLDRNWDSRVVYTPKNMTGDELKVLKEQLHRDFYSYRNIIKRMSFHRRWSYWFAFNLLYRQTVVAARSHDVASVGA
ncbi:MAG: B12-binding domain-containing radical SAM protein [Actinobacteria bacterium]|nr:B12-binding domain-containing radical SAM protein [Actinomycetota bacterium]MBU1942480.1 B12-binding domain-containing radical SAM protein [Actinomycetota bacterium]MBU2687049.1 B12-binding domain-containing radical SAM protein [Actinomycetota bacterium]